MSLFSLLFMVLVLIVPDDEVKERLQKKEST